MEFRDIHPFSYAKYKEGLSTETSQMWINTVTIANGLPRVIDSND